MPVSNSSMKIRYSLTRSLTDQEARTASGMSNVVSRTRNRLRPSIPTMYWMPKAGIQGIRSTSCISPVAPSKRLKTLSDQRKASALASSATENSAWVRLRGTSKSNAAPITGMARSRVKSPGVKGDMFTAA